MKKRFMRNNITVVYRGRADVRTSNSLGKDRVWLFSFTTPIACTSWTSSQSYYHDCPLTQTCRCVFQGNYHHHHHPNHYHSLLAYVRLSSSTMIKASRMYEAMTCDEILFKVQLTCPASSTLSRPGSLGSPVARHGQGGSRWYWVQDSAGNLTEFEQETP